jgi:DNA polymerase-1
VDAFSLVYRAFFALPPMSTTRGEPTSALYGFSSVLLKLLREERPVGVAVALDRPEPTFRHARYRGYKASRPRAPSPLSRQLQRLGDLLAAFGFPTFAAAGFEADDLLATLCCEVRRAGEVPLVATGDLDALQCAFGPARVHVVGRGTKGQTYDEAAVWARYGVGPGELPDWKALAGDPTDEIPGVPGIGARGASTLIRRFGRIPQLLGHLDEIPARVRAAIEERAEDLLLWRDLARVRDDVSLPDGPRWMPFDEPARRRVRAIFDELEFKSLVARVEALPGPPDA